MKKLVLLFSVLSILTVNGFSQTSQEKKWIRQQFAALTLNEKIAQLMVLRVHSNWKASKLDSLGEIIKKYNIGGLCFF